MSREPRLYHEAEKRNMRGKFMKLDTGNKEMEQDLHVDVVAGPKNFLWGPCLP